MGYWRDEQLRTQIISKFLEIPVTAAANAGSVIVATVTGQDINIESVILRSNGATTADLTTAAIKAGASAVIEIIGAGVATQAELDAEDKQVAAITKVSLEATKTIIIDLQGTGATAVDFTVIVEYGTAGTNGGYLV